MCSKCGFTWNYIINLCTWSLILHLAKSADDTNPSIPYGFPHITEHPQDDYFAKNNPATLNCKADGTPSPKITWYKDGRPVETNRDNPISHRMLLDNGQLFFLRVIHSKNNHPDIGEYYCNATNKHGTAISRIANIQIAVLRDDFRQEPMDTTTAVGQTVVLHCRPPRGKPDPKVIWRKDGESVQPDERIQIQEDGDLVITSVVKGDVGEYSCLAINTGGEKQSNPAQLRVLDVPVFHKLPKDVTTEEGKTIEFYCDVMGDPPINVQWSKEDGAVSFGRARILSDHTLRIESVETNDEGVYICTAENAAGSTQATARLTVFSSPSFLIRPRDQVVAVGRTVTLQCVATGNPVPTVFWSKESKESLMFPNRDEGRYSVSEDGTFRIADVTYDDAGVYKCEALNIRGQASASAKVQVRADGDFRVPAHDPRPPPIIKIGPYNQTLPVDGVALLRCQAEGDPDPIIRWYRNGRPLLMTDPRLTKLDSGTLQISDLKIPDTGIYTCKAVSEAGETTWDSYLKVEADVGQKFFRIPSVASLPDPPTKPVVSEVTDTSVHLSWAPGTQIGASPVFAFQVDYFGFGTTEGWVSASDSVKRESYTVEKLRPNTTYLFLIRARNSQGVGLPSLVSNPVKTAVTGSQIPRKVPKSELEQRLDGKVVEIVMAKSVNSTAVSVSWKVLKGADLIEGFFIHYRHITDIRRLKYGTSYQLPISFSLTSYTLTELSPYNWYEICVLAYSRDVQTKCSSPIKVQTEEDVLVREPGNIVIHKDSSTSMTILWSPPLQPTGTTQIKGYKIRCLSEDEKHNCSMTTTAETNNAVVSKLRRDQKYRLQLAAMTNQGYGKWSKVYIVGDKVFVSDEEFESTTKQLAEAESEPSELMKKPWFIGVMIGTVGGMLWLIFCILTIWLCKRRKNKKKMKDQRYYTGVPLHKDDNNRNMMYPPQYGTKDHTGHCTNDLDLPAEFRVLLPPGKKEQEINEENLYKVAGEVGFPEMKTFYQKVDPVAPYATTALLQQQQQNLLKQRGLEHMFRPINQGYIQHSEGSGDSYHKPEPSTDSNNSRPDTDIHDHSDHMQSPVSDSGSHTTDENGLLIKQQRKKHNNMKRNIPNKPMVNLSEFLPPPPEHPPPSECGEPPSYQEVRGDRDAPRSPQSPLSPVSFSQVSACSCPNPHTQTPVSGWNMPVYSDNECPRCNSEKYFDPNLIPGTYTQNPYIQRTQSPRTLMLQNMNNRNIQNCSHAQSPRGTPHVNYQYSQPIRGTPNSNYSASQKGSSNPNRSSHSDTEGNNMPCFQSYRITPQGEKDRITHSEKDYRIANSEKDYRLANSEMDYRLGREPHWVPNQDYRFLSENEWGPGPAPPCRHCEHDSGTGLEDEEGSCMDRACQSSLPSLAGECINNSLYPPRPGMSSKVPARADSPTSEGADYAADSDLDNPAEQRDGNTDQCNSDCSSVHSSSASSGEGSFLTEADFASAVARAAEMSGLTVVGTTVCDLNNKAKKEKRHRRPARPISPGYSTDSNYGSIDIVHKPYPKSQRKKQLMEQGKGRSGKDSVQKEEEQPNSKENSSSGVYDMPYSKPNIQGITPKSPVIPQRVSSLNRSMPSPGAQNETEKGQYSSFLINQPLREDVV